MMNPVVADPRESSLLEDPTSRLKLRLLLDPYEAAMPYLRGTYQSESEIIAHVPGWCSCWTSSERRPRWRLEPVVP